MKYFLKNKIEFQDDVLLARNLALNSNAALNNKYMFGLHRRLLPHLWNITVKYIQIKPTTVMKKC